MVARRGHTARVEDDDVVGVADGVEPVGDDEAGAAAAGRRQCPDDPGLTAFVDGAGGLVEDQDRASVSNARARASRWRCPPESVAPRSPTSVA